MSATIRHPAWSALPGTVKALAALVLVCTAPIASSDPVRADDCHETIAAMFDGGALDPFVRPPHRLTNTVRDADGNEVRRFLTLWETPYRSVSGVEGSGMFVMVISQESWFGQTIEGPWIQSPNNLPDDHDAVRREQHGQEIANLTETDCLGEVAFEGGTYTAVSYVTKTDPNPQMNDAWFGARHTVYIDRDTDRVAWWQQTEFVSSFAPDVSNEVHTLEFSYDPDLVIPRPE